MADAQYAFLSFVRAGFAASITQPDTFAAGQPALAAVPVGAVVSGVAAPLSHRATVRGPGDVVGLSPSQVVRTDPIDGAVGVEPNYFAQVEFDRPDLPWLFTPAAAAGDRLRPWIVLVVVDADGAHACRLEDGSPLPQLIVPAGAAAQLPDLASSYLWAHAQVITPDGQTVDSSLAGDPRLSVSRLVCPRHLAPNSNYLAAVVPAFEVGLLAGLGQPVTPEAETQLAPAWVRGSETILPVLYSFRFRTGEDADFESLARELTGRPLPEGVGARPLDVSRPGAGLPSLQAPADVHDTRSITWLGGALRPVGAAMPPARDASADADFRARLAVLLDRPAALVRGGDADPVVAPPIYGGQHALVVELGPGSPPPWIAELNLDPRARVAAGLGTQTVQERQDELVNRAWRQLGDAVSANHALRRAQFARTAALRVHARLSGLDEATLLAMAAPMRQRIAGVTGSPVTLARAVRDSRLPEVAVSPAFRRLTRPGAVAARAAASNDLPVSVVTRFAATVFTAPGGIPDGVAEMRPATEVIGPTAAGATQAALGDGSAGGPARLDTALATLQANEKALPAGDTVRAGTQRGNVGAVALVTSMGAVSAASVGLVLRAAAASPAPTRPPGPVRPPPGPIILPPVITGPPVVTRPPAVSPRGPAPSDPITGTPAHAAGEETSGASPARPGTGAGGAGPIGGVETNPAAGGPIVRGDVFTPPGRDVVLDPGHVILRGGTVVLTDDTVTRIATGQAAAGSVSDAQWAGFTRAGQLPAVTGTGDPISDPGTRLDSFRKDPAALTALAQVAAGQVQAAVTLDGTAAGRVTSTAASASLQALSAGAFRMALPAVTTGAPSAADIGGVRGMVAAAAGALDRIVSAADAPQPAAGPILDIAATRSGLLSRVNPEVTVTARIRARLSSRAIAAVPARDPLDVVMACPVFLDPMWEAVRDLGRDWMLPGLELVPPDTATLVETNPSFVAAYLVGLNHEFMRELLWREFPTDRRGTSFTRFWGRTGDNPADIGPVHLFRGDLAGNLLSGKDSEAVLLLRSELLRRYPGSIIYLCRATQQGDDLMLDDGTILLPAFRGDVPPDVTFVGFPITPEALRTAGDPWWFVIAQPPAEPRFGLDDPTADTPAIPATASDLAWTHMAPDGNPASATPFAIADPPLLRGHLLDGSLTWGSSSGVQAHLTYQHPVRVAIRAADLLPPAQQPPPAPGSPAPAGP